MHDDRLTVNRPSEPGEQFHRDALLLANVRDSVIVTNLDGIITYWNEGATRLFGFEASEMTGRPLVERLPPSARAEAAEWIRRLADGAEFQGEWLDYRRDGSRVWIEANTRRINGPGGKPVGIMGVAHDITARKAAEAALRASEERYRTLVQNIRDYAIFMTDPRGFVTEWTEGAQRVKGYTAEEAIGQHVSLFYTPEDIAAGEVEREIQEAARTGRAEREHWRVRKGGERFWGNEIATAIRDADGRLLGFTKISRDLSERKRMQDALAASEEQHRLIVESAHGHGIITTDPRGLITTWNPGARLIFGYEAPEIIGRHGSVLFTPEDVAAGEHDKELATAAREGRASDDRWQVRKDGTRFWASGITAAMRDGDGGLRGFTKVLRDLTDQKLLDEQRENLLAREQEARQAAEAATRMQNDFLATVSHELRTPLSAILLWAKMLESGAVKASERDEAIGSMVRAAEAQKQLIEDLLDFSRMTTGRMRAELGDTDLRAVVRAAADAIRPTAEVKGVRLDVAADEAAPARGQAAAEGAFVRGDPVRLQQVVWNLLSNGVKFTQAGGLVELRLECRDGVARMTVRDTGRGIDPAFLPHVFERFRQGESGTTRSHGGLGLGLAIVRELVHLHAGTVRADSPGEGKGATFTVELPLAKTPAGRRRESPADEAGAGGVHADALAGLRVLLVEDDAETRRALTLVLEAFGARVTGAATAAAGVEARRRERPDVLVSDIGLPGRDGYALLGDVRAVERERGEEPVPAVAVTAYARAEDRDKALAAGFRAHVPKPVVPDDLLRVIAGVTGRRGRP